MVNITCVWGGLFWVAFNVNDNFEVTTARGLTATRATINLINKIS